MKSKPQTRNNWTSQKCFFHEFNIYCWENCPPFFVWASYRSNYCVELWQVEAEKNFRPKQFSWTNGKAIFKMFQQHVSLMHFFLYLNLATDSTASDWLTDWRWEAHWHPQQKKISRPPQPVSSAFKKKKLSGFFKSANELFGFALIELVFESKMTGLWGAAGKMVAPPASLRLLSRQPALCRPAPPHFLTLMRLAVTCR